MAIKTLPASLTGDFGIGEVTCGSINRTSGTLTVEVGGVAYLSITSAGISVTGGVDLGTDEVTCGSINRASGNLTFEIGGTTYLTVNVPGITVVGEVTCSSINRTSGDLTLEIGGTWYLGVSTTGISVVGDIYCGASGTGQITCGSLTRASGSLISYVGGKAGLSISLAETVINDDSWDMNFRVESNANANMFFVDANDEFVVIGSNTRIVGTELFSVAGAVSCTGLSSNATISITSGGLSITSGDVGLGTGEITCGSINRASGTLTVEIGGTAILSVISTALNVTGNVDLTTGELICGSINRASGTLTVEIGGTSILEIESTGININGLLNRPNASGTEILHLQLGDADKLAIASTTFLFSLTTKDLRIDDAGTVAATEVGWITVNLEGTAGYIRVYAAK